MGAADEFKKLPIDEQKRFCNTSQQLCSIARNCAIPIALAPRPGGWGKVNHATGFALQMGSAFFSVTASHVLTQYEIRLQKSEEVNWQLGNLRPFNPLSRVVWRSVERNRDEIAESANVRLPAVEGANRDGRDIVIMRLYPEEASHLKLNPNCIISTPTQWPPSAPVEQNVVLVAGYPFALREVDHLQARVSAGAYTAMLRVTNCGDGYFKCRIEQQELVSFDGSPLPEPGSENMEALSGGPALLMGAVYPVVGVVTDCSDVYELHLLHIATLDNVDERDFRNDGSKLAPSETRRQG